MGHEHGIYSVLLSKRHDQELAVVNQDNEDALMHVSIVLELCLLYFHRAEPSPKAGRGNWVGHREACFAPSERNRFRSDVVLAIQETPDCPDHSTLDA